jgi:hypothetical protein
MQIQGVEAALREPPKLPALGNHRMNWFRKQAFDHASRDDQNFGMKTCGSGPSRSGLTRAGNELLWLWGGALCITSVSLIPWN